MPRKLSQMLNPFVTRFEAFETMYEQRKPSGKVVGLCLFVLKEIESIYVLSKGYVTAERIRKQRQNSAVKFNPATEKHVEISDKPMQYIVLTGGRPELPDPFAMYKQR